jgi:hypothetical protein
MPILGRVERQLNTEGGEAGAPSLPRRGDASKNTETDSSKKYRAQDVTSRGELKNAETRLELRGIGPHGSEAGVKPPVEREVARIARTPGSTPFRPCRARSSLDSFSALWLDTEKRRLIPGKRYPPGIKRVGEDRRRGGVCFVRMGRRGCWWRGGRSGRNAGVATRTATLIHAVG